VRGISKKTPRLRELLLLPMQPEELHPEELHQARDPEQANLK